ncbi:protein boule-like isoform X2 [Tachyglossus aculeatus]|nr:protein boule-like isoform X2 [Tachyglossus aculeatus]XP_038605220.1 protein boule-like isoform X2 [Tachyglossus aculeatus]
MQMNSLSPSPIPASPGPFNNPTSAPRFGTVIPNRIFVGGIDFKTNESDLRKFFAQYGAVKEVKIVNDRAGVSKGYGFITFETQEDAQKILQEAEKLNYKDKKLNIGPAIRKQQVGIPRSSLMPAAGTMYLTTSTGYPYTYHNGVAYFHTPEMTSAPPPWPSRSLSSSPVVVAQPVYQQPAYHYEAPAQYLPGQWPWGIPQAPASSTPFLYLHPSEVLYQPLEISQEGGCMPPLSLMEPSIPEFASPGPYCFRRQMDWRKGEWESVEERNLESSPLQILCVPEESKPCFCPCQEPRLHSVRRNPPLPSPVSPKPQPARDPDFRPRKGFRTEGSLPTPPPTPVFK